MKKRKRGCKSLTLQESNNVKSSIASNAIVPFHMDMHFLHRGRYMIGDESGDSHI